MLSKITDVASTTPAKSSPLKPLLPALSSWLPSLRLGQRLSLWYATLFTGSVAVLFAVAYLLMARALAAKDAEILESKLKEYGTLYQAGGLGVLRASVDRERGNAGGTPLLIRLLGRGNVVTFASVPEGWIQLAGYERDWMGVARPVEVVRIPSGAEQELTLGSALQPDGTLLQIGRITNNREMVLGPFRKSITSATLAMAAISLVAGAFLANRALRPVREMTDTARRILATDDLDSRMPVRQPHDDLDELAALFNSVLQRNSGLIRALRESLDNAAHDLKTPLTRLRGTAELALLEANPVNTRSALADCVEESDHVLALLNALLDVTAAEAGLMQLDRKPADLARLAAELVDAYSLTAEEKLIRISLQAPLPVIARVDPVRLRQVIGNLLDNAIKYTPSGGRVVIAVLQEKDHPIIRVCDTGPGIPEEERPRVWTRLFRGDQSRGQQGLGLGLSVVKAIVEAHGGSVALESNPGGGTLFTVRLL